MVKALDHHTILETVESLQGWSYDPEDHTLVRDFAFSDFGLALEFINRVGEVAKELDHHPEIFNLYNLVSLALSTQSVQGITDMDIELARRISFLF